MPRIPRDEQRVRTSSPAPVEVRSSASTALVGRGEQALARGLGSIADFAIRAAEIEERKDKERAKMRTNRLTNKLKIFASEAQNIAVAGSDEEGNGLVDAFESEFDARSLQVLDLADGRDERDELRATIDDIKTIQRIKNTEKANQMFVQHHLTELDEDVNEHTNVVFNNPDAVQSEFDSFSVTVGSLTDLIPNASKRAELIKKSAPKFVHSAIEGNLNKRDSATGKLTPNFQQARTLAIGPLASKHLTSRQRSALLRDIDNRERTFINDGLREDAQKQAAQEALQDLQQSENFGNFIIQAQTLLQQGDQDQFDSLRQSADLAVAKGVMTTQQRNFVVGKVLNPIDQISDNNAALTTTVDIARGQKPANQLITEITQNPRIDAKTKITLINRVQSEAKKTSPAEKERLKAANKLMDSVFGTHDPFNKVFLKGEELRIKAEAEIFRAQLLAAGEDSVAASRLTIERFKGKLQAQPIPPGITGQQLQDPKQQSEYIQKQKLLFKRAKTEQEKRRIINNLKMIKNYRAVLDAENQLKAEAEGEQR